MKNKFALLLIAVAASAGTLAVAATAPAPKSADQVVISETDITDRPYRVLADIAVSVDKVGIIDVPPIRTKVENALKAKAASMGADAVIQTRFVEHGIAMLIRARLEGLGRAVVFLNSAEAAARQAGQVQSPGERQIPSQGEMKAKLQTYLNAINAGDAATAVALYADDATIEDPLGSAVQAGRAAVDSFVRGMIARGTKFELVTPIRGSNINEAAMALKARVGGSSVNVIETFTFHLDGRIASMRSYWGNEDREN